MADNDNHGMFGGWTVRAAVLAAVVVGGVSGAVAAQTAGPAWAGPMFEEIGDAAAEHNAEARTGGTGLFEGWLVRDSRVNLVVDGPDGSRVVYSFTVDQRFRIHDLERGRIAEPTLRVTTDRSTLRDVLAAGDRATAVRQAVRDGRISVKRIYHPLPGVDVTLGAQEAVVGAGGLVLVTLTLAKVGLDSLVAVVIGVIQQIIGAVLGAVRTVWRSLTGIATVLTILEQLELLDRVKAVVHAAWARIRAAVVGTADRTRGTTAEDDPGRDPR